MSREIERFRYSAVLPASFIIVPIMLLALIGYFAYISKGVSDFIVILTLISLSIIMLVLGVSPLLTTHELHQSELVLRQGWYFRLAIPLKHIGLAEKTENRSYGMGVIYTKKLRRLCILTHDRKMVRIKLDDAMIIRVLGFRRVVQEVIVNVNEQDAFVKALGKKTEDSYESLKFRKKAARPKGMREEE